LARWHNWSGKLTSEPKSIHFLRSEQDACALARSARAQDTILRAAGATHSHAPLVQTNGIIADTAGLSGVISTEAKTQTAWIWGGTRIFALGRPLCEAGLGLFNQGDIDQQAIAGATATGTHGTGKDLKNLSASVVGFTLATSSGDLITASATSNSELFTAARQHLGAFGIITRVNLQLRTAYRLAENSWRAGLDELLEDSAQHIAENRHFEFFWYPAEDLGQAKTINETDRDAEYPLADEGRRCAWNYEVLPNHRPHKHTEMEYSIPAEHGRSCLEDLRKLIATEFPDMQWPVEYRTLAADDIWLSTAYQRPTITISVHQDIRLDDEKYFRACEEIFLSYEGRPHWGKVNYLKGEMLAARHPCWEDWWRVRDETDPTATFLNEYMRSIRT